MFGKLVFQFDVLSEIISKENERKTFRYMQCSPQIR